MRNSNAAAECSRARSWGGGGVVGSGVKSHQPPSGHQIHLGAPGLRDKVTHRGNTSLQEQWNENKGRWCRGRGSHRKAEPRAPGQGRADGTAAVTSAPRRQRSHPKAKLQAPGRSPPTQRSGSPAAFPRSSSGGREGTDSAAS